MRAAPARRFVLRTFFHKYKKDKEESSANTRDGASAGEGAGGEDAEMREVSASCRCHAMRWSAVCVLMLLLRTLRALARAKRRVVMMLRFVGGFVRVGVQ
jgi:hypothetical protein